MRSPAFLSSLALFLLGGVGVPADSQTFPSLARRPVESRDFEAEQRAADSKAAEQEAQTPAEPALQSQVAKLDADAKAGAGAFDAAYPAAGEQVAAAAKGGVGDNAYAVAQIAITGLEASRNQSVIALANLDSLYGERLGAIADGKAIGGAQMIDTVRARTLALVDGQNDRLDVLKAKLPLP